MREFTLEDKLFIDFLNNDSEDSLAELIRNVNGILYSIAINLLQDENLAELILDEVVVEFIQKKWNFDIKENGIVYYFYKIEKEKIVKYLL
jgi:hypothetical protein